MNELRKLEKKIKLKKEEAENLKSKIVSSKKITKHQIKINH